MTTPSTTPTNHATSPVAPLNLPPAIIDFGSDSALRAPGSVAPFEPSPEEANRVLTLLADPGHSLLSVAAYHHTTVAALSAWMADPRVVDSLAEINTAAAAKARLSASCQLTRAITPLVSIMSAYETEESHQLLGTSLPSLLARHRQRYTALRAVHLLLRIASYAPPAARSRTAAGQSPRALGANLASSTPHSDFQKPSASQAVGSDLLSGSALRADHSDPSHSCSVVELAQSNSPRAPLPDPMSIEEQILANPALLGELIRAATAVQAQTTLPPAADPSPPPPSPPLAQPSGNLSRRIRGPGPPNHGTRELASLHPTTSEAARSPREATTSSLADP